MKRRNFIKTSIITGSVVSLSGCINNSEESPINNSTMENLSDSSSPLVDGIQDRPMEGDINANYTLISIDDPSCKFCAQFHQETYPILYDELINTGELKRYSLLKNNHLESWSERAMHYLESIYDYTESSSAYFDLYTHYLDNQEKISRHNIHEFSTSYIENNYSVSVDEIESSVQNYAYDDSIHKMDDTLRLVNIHSTPSFALFNGGNLITELNGAYEADVFLTLIQ